MVRKVALVATLTTLVSLTSCATAPPYDPFRIDASEFSRRVTTIAVAPLKVFVSVDNPESVRSEFESLIVANLDASGFATVPSSQYEEVRNEVAARLGGIYDPVSGKADDSKLRALHTQVVQKLSTVANADAILYQVIRSVTAHWARNRANWDGTSEATTSREGIIGALFAPDAAGTIPALSLVVTIKDIDGNVLYVDRGGIQLLAKLEPKGSFIFGGHDFTGVPRHSLFTDSARSAKAVEIALGELNRASVSTSPSTLSK